MFANVPTMGTGVGVGVELELGATVGACEGDALGVGVAETIDADNGMNEESLLWLTRPPISSEGLGVGVGVIVTVGAGVGVLSGTCRSICTFVPVK